MVVPPDSFRLVPFSPTEVADYVWPEEKEHAAREAASGRFDVDVALEIARRIGAREFGAGSAASPGNDLYWVQRAGTPVGSVWVRQVDLGTHADRYFGLKSLYLDVEARVDGAEQAVLPLVLDLARSAGAPLVSAMAMASNPQRLAALREVGFAVRFTGLEADLRNVRRSRFPVWDLRTLSADELRIAMDSISPELTVAEDHLADMYGLANRETFARMVVRKGPLGLTARAMPTVVLEGSDQMWIRFCSALVQASKLRKYNHVALDVPVAHVGAVMAMRKPSWSVSHHAMAAVVDAG